MPQVVFIEPDGRRVAVQAKDGQSAMRAAVDQGVAGIEAECGGQCLCATCHCYVADPWQEKLPPPSADEQVMLENVVAPRLPGSRLSCQIVLNPSLDGLTLTVPPRQS
jgi:ferredoxin, 2Fe-2S